MKTQLRRLAWLALALSAALNTVNVFAAESDIFYDQRIPRQEFGVAPAQDERDYILKAMRSLPMSCGMGESSAAHQAHEQAFKRAMRGYSGSMPAEQVIGHILMTDRGISEAQMVTMVPMLGSMQTADAVTVLRKINNWSGVLASRFVSENVPETQRPLVQKGIEVSLQQSVRAVAKRYRFSL